MDSSRLAICCACSRTDSCAIQHIAQCNDWVLFVISKWSFKRSSIVQTRRSAFSALMASTNICDVFINKLPFIACIFACALSFSRHPWQRTKQLPYIVLSILHYVTHRLQFHRFEYTYIYCDNAQIFDISLRNETLKKYSLCLHVFWAREHRKSQPCPEGPAAPGLIKRPRLTIQPSRTNSVRLTGIFMIMIPLSVVFSPIPCGLSFVKTAGKKKETAARGRFFYRFILTNRPLHESGRVCG